LGRVRKVIIHDPNTVGEISMISKAWRRSVLIALEYRNISSAVGTPQYRLSRNGSSCIRRNKQTVALASSTWYWALTSVSLRLAPVDRACPDGMWPNETGGWW